jgi:L-glyceraldehyde 3-phosphate reductase
MNKVPLRKCGNSGLYLPAVSLGLWHNFGFQQSLENAENMIMKAFEMGITHFDLANNYGPPPGSAESVFGQVLERSLASHRDEILVTTKAGYGMWDGPYGDGGSRKYLISSLDQSLKRMKLDYVDIFYHHRYTPDTPLEETMRALEQIVRSGKALYVGISNYPAAQTSEAVSMLKSWGVPIIVHQPKYNMLDRTPEKDLFGVLEKEGLGAVVFSPLAQGLLTGKYLNEIPTNSRVNDPSGFLQKDAITAELNKKLTVLKEIADNRNQKMSQLALIWALRNPVVASVIIGISSSKQLLENIEAFENMTLSQDELNLIDETLFFFK